MILDKWQENVLKVKGNLCLCSPRQMGKSTIISQKVGDSAIALKKEIMVIAATERQAFLLFEKILDYIYTKNPKFIKGGKDRPTKKHLKLTNGSIIHCLPTGETGYGIRGFTIDELYADEAAYIKEDVWAAVTPMLATTGGSINLLSTPAGTSGYFYDCFHNDSFTAIYVDPIEVIESRDEPQKTNMLEHRKHEKDRMARLQFQQEYLGLFVGGVQRFFDDELIESVCTLTNSSVDSSAGELFQGIDVARMGGDDTVLVTVKRKENGNLVQINFTIPEGQRLTDTARLIIDKDKLLKHRKIYIDDGGLGVGVYDILFDDAQTKRKVIGINNSRRDIDKEKGQDKYRKKGLLKNDLYNNLKNLMERGLIKLYDEPRIAQSLRSVQYENEDGVLKIYGNYTHIVEALIRACWCTKDKSLNIWAR